MTPETKLENSQSVTVTEQWTHKKKKEEKKEKPHAFATSASQTILQKGKNLTWIADCH